MPMSDRQREEHEQVPAAGEARDRHQLQQLAEEELADDDVEQRRDRQQEHRDA